MLVNLTRLESKCWLEINRDKLSSHLGCGLVLSQTPKFHSSEAFHQVFRSYQIQNIYADKTAQKILRTEKIVAVFCKNALAGVALNENFRSVFQKYKLIFLLDRQKESCWILGDADNRLPFLNYYREIIPNILREYGINLTGSTVRLLPIGWQNLYDLIEMEIFKEHPEIKNIEILSLITDVRYCNNTLGLGINLLNLSTPQTIYHRIKDVLSHVTK